MRAKTAQGKYRTKTHHHPRPQTPIFNRPIKRTHPYKPEEIDFYIGVNIEKFGTPKNTTIGSNRKPPKPPPTTPSPCDYDVPSGPIDKHLMHLISDSGHSDLVCNMTTNIDYIDATIFPRNVPKAIGNWDNRHFYEVNDVPPCMYFPDTEFDRPKIKIKDRKEINYDNGIPGPGAYNPDFVLRKPPEYKFTTPTLRFDWLNDRRNNPSPGSYNPVILEKQAPAYTIGAKSRLASDKIWQSSKSQVRKRKIYTPFPMGKFIFRLDETMTVQEVRQYVSKHKSLVRIVNKMIEMVLLEKPEDPVGFIREYFFQLKDKIARNSHPMETDEYDLNEILIQIREKPPVFIY